eukprot:Skav224964  [mRNA]  locus=scaffold3893:6287:8477:+ [translate_table: standard]
MELKHFKPRQSRLLMASVVGILLWTHSRAVVDDLGELFVQGARTSSSLAPARSTRDSEFRGAPRGSIHTWGMDRAAAKRLMQSSWRHNVELHDMTQARGKQKDKEHALKIEKVTNRDEPVKNGDVVMFVMPTGVHMDVLGSAVRARYYDPRGEWQKITIDGGDIYSGDQIFLRGHQGEYLDANPLERAPDGEVKVPWFSGSFEGRMLQMPWKQLGNVGNPLSFPLSVLRLHFAGSMAG